MRIWEKVLSRRQEWEDGAGRHRGGADTVRSDKGIDDGMKMGHWGAVWSGQ